MNTRLQTILTPQKLFLFLLVTVGIIVTAFFISRTMPVGIDWEKVYHRGAQDLLHGRNPYDESEYQFLNPPWLLVAFIPLALLPLKLSGAFFLLASLAGFAYSAYRLGAKPIAMGLFLASPTVLHSLLNGNIDWIPLLGITMTPQLGLFLVVVKPQIGLGVIIFWLVEAWREGGWQQIAKTFAPVTVALLLSFIPFGIWVLKWLNQPEQWWNASLFPYSVPLGLWLLYRSLRLRQLRYSIPAGPMLSPYVLFHAWSASVASLVHNPKWLFLTVTLLWAWVLIRGLLS